MSAGILLAGTLGACGNGPASTGTPTLNWYVNPDNGGQAAIAASCSDASNGAYRIDTSILPSQAAAQREQLMRRLAGNDTSIDLMSLDPVFVPETSEAGFLAKIPAADQQALADGVVKGAVTAATWKGELVAAPFWANTQLLWYRKSVAEAAGLDMTQPVTWKQLIDAAAAQDTSIGVQGTRAESMTVWVNALIASAGGKIIENPDAKGADIELGLDSEAGRAAAQVMEEITAADVAVIGSEQRQGQLLVVGVRPEHFDDVEVTEAPAGAVTFSAQVDVTEWLGNELYAYIPFEAAAETKEQLAELDRELDGESMRSQLVVTLDAMTSVRDGDTAQLWFDPRRLHVFDPSTGENLTRDEGRATAIAELSEKLRLRSLERAAQLAGGRKEPMGARA